MEAVLYFVGGLFVFINGQLFRLFTIWNAHTTEVAKSLQDSPEAE